MPPQIVERCSQSAAAERSFLESRNPVPRMEGIVLSGGRGLPPVIQIHSPANHALSLLGREGSDRELKYKLAGGPPTPVAGSAASSDRVSICP
jgi:hypothetical protein